MNIEELISIGIILPSQIERQLEGTDHEKIQTLLQLVKWQEKRLNACSLAISILPANYRRKIFDYTHKIDQDSLITIEEFEAETISVEKIRILTKKNEEEKERKRKENMAKGFRELQMAINGANVL